MNEEKSAATSINNGVRLTKLNSPWILWPATGLLAALFFFGLDYLITALTHESTDDAFIAAHVVSIAPQVAGRVSAVPVLDNQMIHSNDLLAEIDPADYSTSVTQKQSSADAAAANYKSVLAALDLMNEKVTTAQATADQSKADAQAAQATDTRAQADFQRYTELRKDNTISAQEFDAAQAAVKQADAHLTAARQKAIADASKINESRAELSATEAAVAVALAEMRETEANVRAAHLDLSYTKIHAPCDGRVTRKAVERGDYVQIGQQLMSLVPNDVWVIANFKESQLKEMKPGQRVRVEIDAMGGRTFRAHVDSVQAGSGAAFSLLPPENATGNYVKVVQRVPVKILFDEPLPADHTFGPGLSVTPSVRVCSFEAPAWVVALGAIVLAVAAFFGFRFALNRKLNRTSR